MKQYDIGVYESMMKKNPQNCIHAFFTSTSCCEDVQNNFSESYNNTINKAREMPLVEMLQILRRQAMVRIDLRKKAMQHTEKYSLKVVETIEAEENYIKYCKAIAGSSGWLEVSENCVGFRVPMTKKTCACRKWDMTWIHCRHALRVVLQMKWNAEDYNSNWYLTSRWQNICSDSILPVNGINFWKKIGKARIQPPPRDIYLGPKKKQKRIKGKNESPKKKKFKVNGVQESPTKKLKATKEGRIIQCGNCSLTGHHTQRCPNDGATHFRKLKKSTTSEGVTEYITYSQGEGPSPQSQNSHYD